MSKTRLYQVFDNVAETVYGPIIAVNRDAAAIRIFQEGLADERTDLNKHANDYELLHLGEQDTTTGEVESIEPVSIYSGAQWTRERARAASPSAELPADAAAPLKLHSSTPNHIR